MEPFEPERDVEFYFFRVYDPVRRKWRNTTWRLTLKDAAERYSEGTYEPIESSREVRRVGGDPLRLSTSAFRGGSKEDFDV